MRLVTCLPDDLLDVLHRRDQAILNALPPEPTVSGAFEVVILRGLAKTTLNQGHSTAAISPGGQTVGLRRASSLSF